MVISGHSNVNWFHVANFTNQYFAEAYLICHQSLAAFSQQHSLDIIINHVSISQTAMKSIALNFSPPWQLFPDTNIQRKTNMMFSWVCIRDLLAKAAKPLFQLILLASFLYFFGLPAVETYSKKEVMVVEKKRDTDGHTSYLSFFVRHLLLRDKTA